MGCSMMSLSRWSVLLAMGLLSSGWASRSCADWVSLTSAKDNTLFQYDPDDPSSQFNSNGSGNFFGAGCTFSRSQIQRGLIQFDLSGVPAGAKVVPGSVTLRLYVVDAPKKDPVKTRPFWLVRLTGLAQMWGEGISWSTAGGGGGGGAPAEAGDATWFHTQYDPDVHDPTEFIPGGSGFWPEMGALGNAPVDAGALSGSRAGTAGDKNEEAWFAAPGMADDLNAWLQDPSSNFGWIVLGDETIIDPDASTKRGFASREHADPQLRPWLTFEYSLVPEPGCALLLASAAAALLWWRRRRS